MPLINSHTRFGSITKVLHWLTVLLIFTAIPLGVIAHSMPYETGEALARKGLLFSLHKTVGVSVFWVALLRIAWAVTQRRPVLLNADRPVEAGLAETVHWLLYGSIVIVPLTGWMTHAASEGFAPILWPFGQTLFFVPKSPELADQFALLHKLFERVLLFSIILHVLGAFKHHFLDRDLTLRRMLPWTPAVFGGEAVGVQRQSGAARLIPLAIALCIWAMFLAGGLTWGFSAKEHHATPSEPAEQAPPPTTPKVTRVMPPLWVVESGTLTLAVSNFGSRVEGTFAVWDATIHFDSAATAGVVGQVSVGITIPSLALGSLTADALGANYFAADRWPSATYTAELSQADGGYRARGQLTVKGVTRPLEFPFDLQVNNGRATATFDTRLKRLDFGIGTNLPDDSTLGLDVTITGQLTARLQGG